VDILALGHCLSVQETRRGTICRIPHRYDLNSNDFFLFEEEGNEQSSGQPSPLDLDESMRHLNVDDNARGTGPETCQQHGHKTVEGNVKIRDSGYFPALTADEGSDTEDDATTWYETEWSMKPLGKGRGLAHRLAV
jgi:hypothetical protein